jgi:putative membrane protein insertion efficiency factor
MPPNEVRIRFMRISMATLPRRAAHVLIRAYQLTFSALLGRQCRHEPTCSAYMDEAIVRHGLWAGGLLGLARICRCQPWGTSGYDPVPEHLPGRGIGLFLYGLRRGRAADPAHGPH